MYMKDGTYAVDNSTLKATARCQLEAQMRYHHGYALQEARAPLEQGLAGHEALAFYMQHGHVNGAMKVYENEYYTWAMEHVEDPRDRLSYFNTARVLRLWMEPHPVGSLPYEVDPEYIEVGMRTPLDEQTHYVGRLDMLVRDKSTGQLAVLDHKFTGRIDDLWTASWRLESQLTGYMWGAESIIGEPVHRGFINAIEVSKLPDSQKKCPKHKMVYAECGEQHMKSALISVTRTPYEIEMWKHTAQLLSAKFEVGNHLPLDAVPSEGFFHGACRLCEFKLWCQSGRPEDMMHIFKRDPWQPFE